MLNRPEISFYRLLRKSTPPYVSTNCTAGQVLANISTQTCVPRLIDDFQRFCLLLEGFLPNYRLVYRIGCEEKLLPIKTNFDSINFLPHFYSPPNPISDAYVCNYYTVYSMPVYGAFSSVYMLYIAC